VTSPALSLESAATIRAGSSFEGFNFFPKKVHNKYAATLNRRISIYAGHKVFPEQSCGHVPSSTLADESFHNRLRDVRHEKEADTLADECPQSAEGFEA